MERVDLPDDDHFSRLDIVVTLLPFTHLLTDSKPLNGFFHIFRKKTIHSFMIPLATIRHNWFAYILFTDIRKTNIERIKCTTIKKLVYLHQHMEIYPLLFNVI